ncbi:hypothetical protein FACS1894156_7640 [Bacteroidia bacterium]|nr:hypothetical protein FACS1894156_7640 [Bacteroidia bacterium]
MKQIVELDNRYEFHFDYAPYIIDAIRLIPGRRWDALSKIWTVPKSSGNYVAELAKRYNFNFKSKDATTPDVFKNFNYDIAPMPELHEDIPLLREMFPFQRQGVAYALDKKRLIIGDQPGLGKTVQAIATIVAVQEYPCLVICPNSLKINWQLEIEMWTSKKAIILNDTIKNTWKYFYEAGMAQFFIVNYESLKKYFVSEIKRPPIDPKTGKPAALRINHIKFSKDIDFVKSVIVDESHRVKDISTHQTKFTKGICSGKEYRLLLTGTPVVNKPKDLVAQLGILDRLGNFGGYSNFLKCFCDAEDRWRELNVLLRNKCFYRREKSDVLKELPAKVRQSVMCNITTMREYNAAMDDLQNYLVKYKSATDEQVQRAMRGEVMVKIGILKNISARGKIADVVDYVSDVVDSGEKIILFTHLREVQDMLKKFFPASVTIFGGDTMQERQRNVDMFQKDPNVQVIICSIKAAGVGITLTASSRVAFVELPWHPADCEQCEDRAHRIGQTDSVQCTYFLGKDTIDEHIYKLIDNKRSMSNQITGAKDEVQESIINGVIELLSKK